MAEQQKQRYSQFKGQPRLPKFAIPTHYELKLKPDLIACKFSGAVKISFDVVSDTKFLVLNAAELSINPKSVFFAANDKVVESVEVELCEEDEIAVVEFKESLPIGAGFFSMEFDGTLNDRMKGFYRRLFIFFVTQLCGIISPPVQHCCRTVDGRVIRAHQMKKKKKLDRKNSEPLITPAGSLLYPVATFKITLEVPFELVALSNMPVIEETVCGDLKTVCYQESPIMSTYLVAVVVGLFDYIEDRTLDGILVRVYFQVGKASQGKFALDVAVKTLGLYKEYFEVPYSLPKLDMIAILDFAAGAMENYGLVTYRETALLYDDKHSAATNKQRVAIVVSHELAHQWFGNLVTMEWWTHLWLNEGFATWVSYLAADSLFPEWQVWTQFLEESTEGLRLDGLAKSHPIEIHCNC